MASAGAGRGGTAVLHPEDGQRRAVSSAVVHAVVVLLPLTVIGTIGIALWPAMRRHFALDRAGRRSRRPACPFRWPCSAARSSATGSAPRSWCAPIRHFAHKLLWWTPRVRHRAHRHGRARPGPPARPGAWRRSRRRRLRRRPFGRRRRDRHPAQAPPSRMTTRFERGVGRRDPAGCATGAVPAPRSAGAERGVGRRSRSSSPTTASRPVTRGAKAVWARPLALCDSMSA